MAERFTAAADIDDPLALTRLPEAGLKAAYFSWKAFSRTIAFSCAIRVECYQPVMLSHPHVHALCLVTTQSHHGTSKCSGTNA